MLVIWLYVLCPILLFPTLNYFINISSQHNVILLICIEYIHLKQVHYRIYNILLGFISLKDLEKELYYVSAIVAHHVCFAFIKLMNSREELHFFSTFWCLIYILFVQSFSIKECTNRRSASS